MNPNEFATFDASARPEVASPRIRLPRPMRERQMVDAATPIFAEHGYHSASMDQIAAQAGISKPMLYTYFDSKENLYTACIERAGADLAATVQRSFDSQHGPERSLYLGFKAFFEFLRNRPDDFRLISSGAGGNLAQAADLIASANEELRRTVERMVEVASRETQGDPFASLERRESAACAILGAAFALGARWLDAGAETPPEVPSEELMNCFWLGFNDLANGILWSASDADKP